MHLSPIKQDSLPFKSRMLALSLAVASLLLGILYVLARTGYLAAETAIWAAVGVFVIAAIYESYLFSLVTRHMMQKLGAEPKKPRTGKSKQ